MQKTTKYFLLLVFSLLLSLGSTRAQDSRSGLNTISISGGMVNAYDGFGMGIGFNYEREFANWLGLEFSYHYEYQDNYPSEYSYLFDMNGYTVLDTYYDYSFPFARARWNVISLGLNLYPLNRKGSKITFGLGVGVICQDIVKVDVYDHARCELYTQTLNDVTSYGSLKLEYEYTFPAGLAVGVGSRLNVVGYEKVLMSPYLSFGYRF
ncbi:MAG: hypothetical protein R3Y19_00290 [Rikenellaceae bacterium]